MSILIVGYGNVDRQDDGVAWHVLFGIAERIGYPTPASTEDGFNPLGQEIDLCYVLQLVPEMSADLAKYDQVCFVDAHTGNIEEDLQIIELQPGFQASPLTHHLTPESLLAFSDALYHKVPRAILVSIRGYEFEFERTLSPQTSATALKAVEYISQWIQSSEQPIFKGDN
jgi:hydrogenase maturation protease